MKLIYDKSTHLISFFIIKIGLKVKNWLNLCMVFIYFTYSKWTCPGGWKKLTYIKHTCYIHAQHVNTGPQATLDVKPKQRGRNLEEYTPNLNEQLLAVPEVDGMLSVSNLGWDSKPYDVGAFEGLGVSISLANGSMILAMSSVGLSLVQPKDFSALSPSLSSSASLEDKPYHNTANKDSCQSFLQKILQELSP